MSLGSAAKPQLVEPPDGARGARGGFDRQQRFLIEVRIAGDLALGLLAFGIVLGLRKALGMQVPLNGATVIACGSFLIAGVVGRAIAQHRHRSPLSSGTITGIFALAAAALYPALFFDRALGGGVSRLTLLLFELAVVFAIVTWHECSQLLLHGTTRLPSRNLILVGDSNACTELARFAGSHSGIHIQDVIPDATAFNATPTNQLEQIERLIRSQPIDEIVLVPSLFGANQARSSFYEGVIEISERSRIKLHVCAHWLRTYDRVQLDYFGGYPLLSFSFAPDDAWPLLLKRIIDVGLAAFGLVLASPLLAVASLAILAETGRPVLFSQIRPGLRGRPFRIFKLRTMIIGAESQQSDLEGRNEVSSIAFKLTNDPRITRVGRWLRKSSLDEIPQLFNVLKGEMSMVGPRPIPCELDRYDLDHLRRLAMKPGVTGLWQVSGRNQIADFSRWLELDTEYIRSWSLPKDFVILLRTVWTVLRFTGK